MLWRRNERVEAIKEILEKNGVNEKDADKVLLSL